MAAHEHTTQTILRRLDTHEQHLHRVETLHETRYNKMNDWGANITMQIHSINENIKALEANSHQQQHTSRAIGEELRDRLKLLETCCERDAATNAAASAEAARQTAAGVADARLRNIPAVQRNDTTTTGTTLIIAGFGRDRPAEVIERTCRRLLAHTTIATSLGFAVGLGEA